MMAKQAIRLALALLLALVCGQALALGLGQIQVKSKANQPLLAEIPIISNDPAELQQLQARLASPDTFVRIGLEPPQGVVADLQFAVVRDNNGNLAIRVTSTQPIDQPMLTFLVEVEWAEGKLVREYSALVDPPRDAPSPSAPMIDAPQTAVAGLVSRPIDASPTEMTPAQATPTEAASTQAAPEAVAAQADEPASPPTDVAVVPPPPAPMPAPDEAVAAVTPAPAPMPAQGVLEPVKAGQTLSEIAIGLKPAGYTLDQTMLALLRTNPDAFIGNDINKLKRGAVLRTPDSDEIAKLGVAEAAVIVRDQIQQWRRARQERAQAASIAAMAAAGETPREATNPRDTRAVTDARLEIIPPAADGVAQAGTRSGASAGGEGDMLRQELQTTKETLAARDAEVQELKSRLADLEKLQQQQQQLITMKDSELAAAQQRLAQSNQAAAKPVAATQTPPGASPVAPEQAGSGTALWLGGGLILVLVGLVGWWFARRGRSPAVQKATRPFTDSAELAASMPNATAAEPVAPVPFVAAPAAAETRSRSNGAGAAQPAAAPVWSGSAASAPTWHAGGNAAANSELRVGHERIELARAYLDLGDHDTARSLLQEIVQVGDPDARAEAVRMLQELPR